MRTRVLTGGALTVLLATVAVGWVVAQESQIPPVAAPPEETAAAPATPAEAPRPYSTDESGLPTAPVPYEVLRPQKPRPQQRATRTPSLTPQAELPMEAGELPPQAPRVKRQAAILQAVDKVTAETLKFEAEVGKPVRYKTLVFTLRACETEAVDEPVRESAAHMTITSQPKAQPGRVRPEAAQVFRGWMFGSSAGLNPFEHPIYDAWLIACKTPPEPAATVPLAPPRATPAAPAEDLEAGQRRASVRPAPAVTAPG